MGCYYKIHLPGGEFITISSPANLISDNELDKDLSSYYSEDQIAFHEAYKELLRSRLNKNIEGDKTFDELSDEFYKKYEDNLDKLESLIYTINSRYKLSGLEGEAMKKVIRDSNPENLVENINDKIREKVTEETFEQALRKWSYQNHYEKKKKGNEVFPKDLGEFLKLTSRKVTPKYFDQLPFIDIVGKSNVKNEIAGLNAIIKSLENDYNLSSNLQKDIKDTLNILSGLGLNDSNILFGMASTGSENDTLVIPKTDDSQGFIFYNKNNNLSLFLGVFKYITSHVKWNEENTNALKEIVKNWNKSSHESAKIDMRNFDPIKFFTGEYKKEEDSDVVTFKDAKFHRFISDFSFSHIAQIVDLIVDNLDIEKSDKLKMSIKKTMKWIDPKKYGTSIFSTNTIASSEAEAHVIKNQEIKNELIAREYGPFITTKTRDYHYAPVEVLTNVEDKTVGDVVLELNDIIDLGKDLLRIPIKEKTVTKKGEEEEKIKETKTEYLYVIPTKITNDTSNIYVKGVVLENGVPVERGYTIKSKSGKINIEYRKFETAHDPVFTDFPGKLENGILIKSKDRQPLARQIVKNYAQIGSAITFVNYAGVVKHSTVAGVYPGNMTVVGERFPISYDKVMQINSIKFTEDDLKDWKQSEFKKRPSTTVSGVYAKNLPTKGDVVKFSEDGKTRFNRVLYSDKENVYIMVNLADGNHYVEKLPRQKISEALINFDEVAIEDEIIKVGNDNFSIQNDKSIRNNKYSYSENVEDARDGDILSIFDKTSNEIKYMKLIDKNTMKVAERTGMKDYRVTSVNKAAVVGVYSSRNISGQNALDIIRVNSRKLYTSNKAENNTVTYIVPKGTKLENAILFDSLYFNVGQVLDKDHYENNKDKYAEYDDVTEKALSLISKKLNQSVNGINFKSLTDNHANERIVDDLFNLYGYDKLSEEDKVSAIQVGAYLRLKNNSKTETKIYRVANDLGDSAVIEYSVFAPNGEIKTIRKVVNKTDLANSIKDFYLIKNNSKIQPLQKKIKDIVKDDKRTNKDIRASFVNNLKGVFTELKIDIPIKLVSAKNGGFVMDEKTRQKAKIENGQILINSDDSTAEDVVHEFLHVFMIGLKYSNPDKYSNLMLDFWRNKISGNAEFKEKYGIDPNSVDNLDKMEEAFVRVISNILVEKDNLDVTTMESIELALAESIDSLGLDVSNFTTFDLYEVLNTPIKKLVGLPTNSKLFSDLLVYEANFREWIDENVNSGNLNIKCE